MKKDAVVVALAYPSVDRLGGSLPTESPKRGKEGSINPDRATS